jgi:cobalt-zinc-cadmium efflux system outer membrane protein
VYEEVTAALQQGVDITRKQVEDLKTRPRTDLLRLEALQAEAKIGQARSRINVQAGWRQLATEIGVPDLPFDARPETTVPVPHWEADAVMQRVQAGHSELMQAGVEADRARIEVDRARAEACPNIIVGGGYSRDYAEKLMGGVISLETPLPVWDRKQGKVLEARARLDRAEASRHVIAARLARETTDAFARYDIARLQVDRLTTQVLPRLRESLDLVQKGYQAGAAQITFADVLLVEESLNETKLKQAEARRELWRALADLQGLMQLEVGEELGEGNCR